MQSDQFRVSVLHHLDDTAADFVKERLIQAQGLAVVQGAAHDEAQHVAAAFVRGQHAVGNQEGRRAGVVSDDAQGNVRIMVRAVLDVGEAGGLVDERPEEIGIKF